MENVYHQNQTTNGNSDNSNVHKLTVEGSTGEQQHIVNNHDLDGGNCCARYGQLRRFFNDHKKQEETISAGICLLLAHGMHFIWGLRTLRATRIGLEPKSITIEVLLAYHFGEIIGAFLGALLVSRFRKKTIYVRIV